MTRTKKILLGLGVGAVVLTAGCSGRDNFRDVEGSGSKVPDSVEVFSNVDKNPNITKVCIDGVAFATTTRPDMGSILRVEAWDKTCPAK